MSGTSRSLQLRAGPILTTPLFHFPHLLKVLLPRAAKYLFWLILLINARSLPFAWHIRLFRPVVNIHFQHLLFRIKTLGQSKAVKEEARMKWLDSFSPIGENPFDKVTVYKTWASLDDCDYYGHLSNSSYAKILDAARFKSGLEGFPAFFRAGGWIALGAAHYSFLQEIPMLARYEIRMNIVAWDNKWLFLVGRFVSHAKLKGKKGSPGSTPPSNDTFVPSIHIPSTTISGTSTPSSSQQNEIIQSLLLNQRMKSEPDGATLHCLSISEICFKHGRIMVPPAIVLASNGYCSDATTTTSIPGCGVDDIIANSKWTNGSASIEPPPPPPANAHSPPPYSKINPPPHWKHVRSLRFEMGKFVKLLRGGWRDVDERSRWWDEALAGLEERQVRNLEMVRGVRDGMVGARG